MVLVLQLTVEQVFEVIIFNHRRHHYNFHNLKNNEALYRARVGEIPSHYHNHHSYLASNAASLFCRLKALMTSILSDQDGEEGVEVQE